MKHEKNEKLARKLRAIADRIEKSPHEYSSSTSLYGGSLLLATVNVGAPLKFGPPGLALVIGDEDFVRTHQVAYFEPSSC